MHCLLTANWLEKIARAAIPVEVSTYNQKKTARLNRHVDHFVRRPELTPEDLLLQIKSSEDTPFILLLDGVEDPHNLGACLRTANAAGVQAVVAPRKGSVGLTEAVRRISCGGADHVPYVQVTNLNYFLRSLQDLGLWAVATSDQSDTSIYDCNLDGPLALVMGAEGRGVRNLTGRLCDQRAQIPMHGHVDCLNLSVATGVCLFEALRQRTRKKVPATG